MSTMSLNIFNRDDGNKVNSYAQIDKNFDAYWENEARNPNRNRIRIGRQYQATVSPMLKMGVSDSRRLEDFETLKWNPSNPVEELQLQQYLQLAKAISRFERPLIMNSKTSVGQENVSAPPSAGTRSARNAAASTNGLHASPTSNNGNNINGSAKQLSKGDDSQLSTNDQISNGRCTNESASPKSQRNSRANHHNNQNNNHHHHHLHHQVKENIQQPQLQQFIAAHHPPLLQPGCQLSPPPEPDSEQSILKTETMDENSMEICAAGLQSWSPIECALFAQALAVCGKNFALIRKDYLPWKSGQSIMDFYYALLGRSRTAPNSDDVNAFAHCYGRPPRLDTDLNASTNLSANNETANNNLGSLKFYKDGQLVLKLNAKQQPIDKKCQWEESADSVSRLRPLQSRKVNRRRRCELPSVRSRQSSEERDELRSTDSPADEDSLDSADSAALIPSMNPLFKKARVKVENNCYIPLPSPASSIKAEDDLTSDCNTTTTQLHNSMINNHNNTSPSPPLTANEATFDMKRKHRPLNSNSTDTGKRQVRGGEHKEQQPPVAHAASRPLDRLTASIALDLTRKLVAAESAQLLSSPAPAHHPFRALTSTAFEPIDFALKSNTSVATAAAAAAASVHPFLLNMMKGVNSK